MIKKNRPEWQRDKYNGIGGKVEAAETPTEAMMREFNEEAGKLIKDWEHYCTMIYPEAIIYCFRAFGDYVIETKTDEIISWYPEYLLPEEVIPNLNWLIPLAEYKEKYLARIEIVTNQEETC